MSEHKAREAENLQLADMLEQASKRNTGRPTCITCRHCFFTPQTAADGKGQCWRNPPTVSAVSGAKGVGMVTTSPEVMLLHRWCGFHEPEQIIVATGVPRHLSLDKGP